MQVVNVKKLSRQMELSTVTNAKLNSRIRALVLGYYDHKNCGDEAYKCALPLIFPNFDLTFVSADKAMGMMNRGVLNINSFDLIIYGCGDLFTPFFTNSSTPVLEKFQGPKFGFSLGSPLVQLLRNDIINKLDLIFTRCENDSRRLQKKTGTNKCHHLPDAAFALYRQPNLTTSKQKRTCFFAPIQSVLVFDFLVKALVVLLEEAAQTFDEVRVLRFDTSGTKGNDDKHIMEKLYSLLTPSTAEKIHLDLEEHNPEEMMDIIQSCSFGICMRLHSHIFSMCCGVPFFSISTTRKTRKLMEEAELSGFQYLVDLDRSGNPIACDVEELLSSFRTAVERTSISAEVGHSYAKQSCARLLDGKVEKLFRSALYDHLRAREPEVYEDSLVEEALECSLDKKLDRASVISSFLLLKVLNSANSSLFFGLRKKIAGEIEKGTTDSELSKTIRHNLSYLRSLKEDTEVVRMEEVEKLKINFEPSEYKIFSDCHRYGWGEVVKFLTPRRSSGGVLLDLYVDWTFNTNLSMYSAIGKIPYTQPWIGFIHHTEMGDSSAKSLFNNPYFLNSLENCYGLFAMSSRLVKFLRRQIASAGYDVEVSLIYHPVPPSISEAPKFSTDLWLRTRRIVQIGSWMRNPFTFYLFNAEGYNKVHLRGKMMDSYFPYPKKMGLEEAIERIKRGGFSNLFTNTLKASDKGFDINLDVNLELEILPCRPNLLQPITGFLGGLFGSRGTASPLNRWYSYFFQYCEEMKITGEEQVNFWIKIVSSVSAMNHLSNRDYDVLLSSSIVYLNLEDAAAVNTILECIHTNTPMIINRIPGTVEILGDDYPLYTDQLGGQKLKNLVGRASRFLAKMDKRKYTYSHFLETFERSAVYTSIP
jgi:polysaccharide pyruvyl transferase WcaK-like protein